MNTFAYLFFFSVLIIQNAVGFHTNTAISKQLQSRFLSMMEKTYIMIKPDGVQRQVVGNIISRYVCLFILFYYFIIQIICMLTT